jgi:hypothetical protein
VGAGLADPEGVRGVEPFVFVAEPTESFEGLDGVDVVTRRVGIRDVPSSEVAKRVFSRFVNRQLWCLARDSPLLLRDRLDPCREPLRLSGRELGFELPREPPGVIPVLRERKKFLFLTN